LEHVRLVAWWLAIFWLWMLLVGEWNETEWIAGAIAAALTTLVAELVWRASGLRVRIPAGDVVSAWTLPAVVVLDFGVVLWALLRRRRGTFVTRRLRAASGPAPRRFGSRAWRGYLATISPNAYPVDLDEERGEVLLHDLVPLRKSEEPVVE
jgi:hypothetical protein